MRLIDADALINDILTDYGCDPKYIADETIDGLKPYTDNLILERIGLQPTIDAVPVVHGEWIKTDDNICYARICSVCRKHVRVCIGLRCHDCDTEANYCPNCGAVMYGKDGERDDES